MTIHDLRPVVLCPIRALIVRAVFALIVAGVMVLC